ncbi:MAG TPA: hypothetical protein VNV63_05595, partial [Nitrospiria bacterium]|nr:hypothetical protein [Nitrospiria bacterium]
MRKTKENKFRVRSLVKNVSGYLALRYTFIIGICLLVATVQLNYRVPSSFLFLALPGIGVALSVLGFSLVFKQLMAGVPSYHPFSQALQWIEGGAYLLVSVFVLSSILLYANGRLDHSLPVNRSSEILTISGGQINLGLKIPYVWVSLRSWEDPDRTERLLLKRGEQRVLWGGQPVVIQIQHGYFGIPWAFNIQPDEEKYNLEILKLAPTALAVRKKLINFYLDHQRWEEAAAMTDDYLKIYPNDGAFALEVGSVLNSADEYGQGIQFLDHVVQRRPTYEACQLLGAALSHQGKKTRAAEVFNESI